MSSDEPELPESGVFHKVVLPVRLVCISGPLQGQVINQWSGTLCIGRAFTNDIVLPDESISKAHAHIICVDDTYYLEDLNSSNGTFLQGRKITKEKLQNGHVLRIGLSSFRFETVMATPEVHKGNTVIQALIAAIVLVFIAILVVLVKIMTM